MNYIDYVFKLTGAGAIGAHGQDVVWRVGLEQNNVSESVTHQNLSMVAKCVKKVKDLI